MCDFNAKELLEQRRLAPLTFSPKVAFAAIAAIDELRWSHEEETGCHCWDEVRGTLQAEGKADA